MNCDCMERINEKLQETHPGVYLRHFTNLETGKPSRLLVVVERRTGKGKVPNFAASFCPFCGTAYSEAKKER